MGKSVTRVREKSARKPALTGKGEAAHAPNGKGLPAPRSGIADPQYRTMLENLPAAVYATDAEGRITFLNEAAAALFGRKPVPGDDWRSGGWRLFRPDGAPMAHDECPMAITLETGEAAGGAEIILERPDGARAALIPCSTPLPGASGAPGGAVNILVEVPESRGNGELLRRTEERYRDVFRNVRVSVWEEDLSGVIGILDAIRAEGVSDLEGFLEAHPKRIDEALRRIRVLDVNDYTIELFGAKDVESLLADLGAVFLPETRQAFTGELLALWNGERGFKGETAVQTVDGRRLDVMFTMSFEGSRCERTIVTMHDITDRKEAERNLRAQRARLATLNRIAKSISRDLDLEHVVQAVTDIATDLSGAKYGAFFYNVTDDTGDSFQLFTLSGAPREAFEKFGLPRNTAVFDPTFRGSGVVRSDDIRKDRRYGRNAPHDGMPDGHLPVVSYLAIPVTARSGEVLGGLFFGHPEAGIFNNDSELLVKGIAAHAAIAIENARLHEAARAEIAERRRAEDAKEALVGEIKHRVKNTLSTVQAIASQTFHSAAREDHDAFQARVQALSGAYDLLTDDKWDRVTVSEVLDRVLDPFRDRRKKRFLISGMEVWLDSDKAVLLAMVLHELATNAVKYGALSNANGRVRIEWRMSGDIGAQRLDFLWQESGGPPVTPPAQRGFGSKLIERALTGEAGAVQLEFAPGGVKCALGLALQSGAGAASAH